VCRSRKRLLVRQPFSMGEKRMKPSAAVNESSRNSPLSSEALDREFKNLRSNPFGLLTSSFNRIPAIPLNQLQFR